MYIVISSFKDLTDNEFEYVVGDPFPREGRAIDEISKERLEQLTSKNNKKGRILIKNIASDEVETEKTDEVEAEKSGEAGTEESKKNAKSKSTKNKN